MRGERFYRRLLRLYPRAFRDRFEEPLVAAFHAERQGRGVLGFWLFMGRDLVSSAARCWWHWVRSGELRHAVRSLRRERSFTIAAVSTLALGIGVTTAVFSIVDHVLLRPLPYRDSERLVRLWDRHDEAPFFSVTVANFHAWRDERDIFQAVGAYREDGLNLFLEGQAERIPGVRVSVGIAEVLGVEPALGRWFSPEEDEPGGPRAAVLSHELWVSRFGGRDMVGDSLTISGEPTTVVGILPQGFELPEQPRARLFVPYQLEDLPEARGAHFLRVLARLAPGIELDEARAAMATVSRRLASSFPETNEGWTAAMLPLREAVSGEAERPLVFLLAAVVCLFLITLVNVSNLLVGRTMARASELALRAALGAGRMRVFGHVLTESVIVASLGALGGLGLAAALVRAVPSIVPDELPRQSSIALDLEHVLFTALLAVLAAVVIGVTPAWHGSRQSVSARLNRFRASRRLAQALVASEVALATTLVIVSGLLLRTFQELKHVDLGFDAENVLTMEVTPVPSIYPAPEDRARLYRELVERFEGLAPVVAAGVVHRLPLDGNSGVNLLIEGEPVPAAGTAPSVNYRAVGGNYFRALGMRLQRGRLFEAEEMWERGDAVVINEAAAERFWPSGNALGTRIRPSPDSPWSTVIGIVSDARESAIQQESEPALYLPYARAPVPGMVVVVRTAGGASPELIAPSVREVFRGIDPRQPVSAVAALPSHLDRVLAPPRFVAGVVASFALSSLLLAAMGIQAVVSRAVEARNQEIGVRIALGAGAARVVSLVLREGMRPVVWGVVAGAALAFLAGRTLSDLTFGVSALDAFSFVVLPAFLLVVALLSNIVPALSASRVDPIETLRSY